MTKRVAKGTQKFEYQPRGAYWTPAGGELSLLPHLPAKTIFVEPCAGKGHLVDLLENAGHLCAAAFDIVPQRAGIITRDALEIKHTMAHMFITNPPWPTKDGVKGDPAVAIIQHLVQIAPVWMLLSADFAHNIYFRKVEQYCDKIVAAGRISWMNNGNGGYDNCAWYHFSKDAVGQPQFYGRAA